jgi:aminoglycoside 6'-N-acetyltransferase I
MWIRDLTADDAELIDQVAAMLVAAFAEHWPQAWPTVDAAREEVRESFAPGRISRVALDDAGEAIGWIGGIPEYDGNVWELHPLVVRPDMQGHGIGQALVGDLEEQVCGRGGLVVQLGTDDEDNMTSLGGVDLFPDALGALGRIRNLRRHPYEFYQRLGYMIVGVIPDANGFGKPDILMAKSMRPRM